jgi:hypothetical protein
MYLISHLAKCNTLAPFVGYCEESSTPLSVLERPLAERPFVYINQAKAHTCSRKTASWKFGGMAGHTSGMPRTIARP